MHRYSRTHVPDHVLIRDAHAAVARECADTADVLATFGELDARKLYLPAGYPSMFAYCVGEFHLSEDAAAKLLRVARAARRCPGVLDALADGRVHLAGLLLLAPHLSPENEAELLAAANHKTKADIERLLAERFPRFDVPATLEAMPAQIAESAKDLPAPGPVRDWPVPQRDEAQSHPRVTPLSSRMFALQCTLDQETHDMLRYAQSLLGHQVPTGDVPTVLKRALDALIASLEKRKFGATSRPRSPRASHGRRHIPAAIKRAVWERDQGQCTFVGEGGRRCASRIRLEFDHVEPVALGGTATVGGIRLRCRGHNQFQVEQTFGADFMRHKRETARAAVKARAEARPDPGPRPAEDDDKDVIPWLRALGYRADQARYAAERCADMPDDASLEERVRVALACLRPRSVTVTRAPRPGAAMAT